VKVLDFGVMKISEDGGAIPKSSLTRTGSTVGTPYYMSLEQLRNSSAVDVRADIYSLGVVMYECLSGRKPFQAETIGDLVYALCSGPPTQLARIRPDVPAEIGDLVMRTLSAKRDDRPSTMVELALALLSFATPAFALWVKVDGKQPALARAPVSAPPAAPRPAIPRLRTAVLEAKAAVPSPSSPSAAAIPPARPSAPIASAPATVGADPGPPRPRPPSPMAEDDGSSGRRDTPTEMFVKGVHAAPEQDDDAPRDRDTPTRALDMSSLPLREAIREAAGDAVGEAAGEAVGEGATPPVEGVPPPTSPAARVALPEDEAGDLPTFDGRRGQDGALVVPTYDPATAMAPSMLTAKLVIPPGGFPPMASDGIAAPSEALAAPRPPWQVTLDRALVSVGGAVDRLMKRFRAAPQNTQIILAIVAGTATIFLLGLILFVAVH
jgi:serine/threonine-protein kinase